MSDCLRPRMGAEEAVKGGAGIPVVNILCSDCINVSILVVTISYVTSGKLGKKHRYLCIIAYNCMWLSPDSLIGKVSLAHQKRP